MPCNRSRKFSLPLHLCGIAQKIRTLFHIPRDVPEAEVTALLALFNNTGGSSWTTKTNWVSCEPVATWYGVGVTAGHVTTLSLPAKNLVGVLPSLSALTELTYLNFLTNTLSGAMPSFAACTKLVSFFLGVNSFSGTLPSFATSPLLEYFWVNNNTLTGTIPSFQACPLLIHFYGNNNQFMGYTDSSFSFAYDLERIYLQNNLLTQGAVDAILEDCIESLVDPGRPICDLNLGGTGNATPSAAGLVNKAILQGSGWTVTTN